MNRIKPTIAALTLLLSLFTFQPARADIAPPEAPPGSTLLPGNETTQVSMAAETVTLDVSFDPADPRRAIARTTASFTMRNLGTQAETLQVRFPLRFMLYPDERYPEINDLRVRVNGRAATTRREIIVFTHIREQWSEETEIPWSVFEASFPPGKDVTIEVSYSVHGFGYYPWQAFRYILETGAGWKGNIGSADIIVRLPYEANRHNVWLDAATGFSTTSRGAQFGGNEVRWHFEDLEPTFEDNIEVSLVTPSLWQKVLTEKANVERKPKDGEAWGRLGKAYKEMAREGKGYPREDAVGEELFALSKGAYERCLELLPEDSLWHTGYADLLWSRYYFINHFSGGADPESLLPGALSHLQTALELDPNNQLARDLLDNISYAMPEAAVKAGEGYDLLALTATPVPPTYVLPPEETPSAEAPGIMTTEVVTTQAPAIMPTEVGSTEAPTERPSLPLCSGAGLILPMAGAAFWRRRRGSRGC